MAHSTAVCGRKSPPLRAVAPSATIHEAGMFGVRLVDVRFEGEGSPRGCLLHGKCGGEHAPAGGERRTMTITSRAPVSLGRGASGHRFNGHRPLHRRQVTATDRFVAFVGSFLGVATHPFFRWRKALGTRDYRAWGILVAALAWTCFSAGHLVGLGAAVAVLAAIDALTWGQAASTFVTTDSCLEFCIISISISAACLILMGMVLVEFQITWASLWVFVGIGVLSLALQILGFRRHLAIERKSHPFYGIGRQTDPS